MSKQNILLQWALEYAGRGWHVFPCHSVDGEGRCTCGNLRCRAPGKHPRTEHGLKDASTDLQVIRAWWATWPQANVGICTGPASGLLILDVDPGHGGNESLGKLEAEHGELPKTVEAVTGGGGWHEYFRYPAGVSVKNSAGRLGPGLDIRAEGGFVIAPPSVHISGNRYAWTKPLGRFPVAEAPEWLLRLLAEPEGKATAAPVEDAIPEGRRNQDLASIAGTLRRRGLGEAEITDALLSVNRHRCSPPLPEAEVRDIAASISRYEPGPARREVASFGLTDMANAQRLHHYHGHRLRYVPPWGKWLVWDGVRWKTDDSLEIERLAKDTVRRIYAEAAADDEHERKSIAQWARQSESEHRLKAMISLAQSEMTITPDALDTDPMLLCCANGYIDLRTGELLPARQENFVTKSTGIPYDPEASCPLWEHFLERVLPDADLRAYIQRAVGYSLTGDVSEQCLFFCFGGGANGKTVFTETIARLFGDYFRKTRSDTLMLTRGGGGIPNDIAALAGSRLVTVSELSSGQRLDEGLAKDLTGGDTLTARFMHKEFFSFRAGFKLWLHGNHKPRVCGKDEGIWRRIRLLPFTVRIPEGERDRKLAEKLESELPGILAWAVRGSLAWQAEGLKEPACVREAVSEYRREQDALADFLESKCVFEPAASVAKRELWESYQFWAEAAGEAAFESQRIFNLEIRQREGVREHRGSGGVREWRGIRLRTDDDPAPQPETERESDSSDRSDRDFGFFYMREIQNENTKFPVTPVTPVTFEREPEDFDPYGGQEPPEVGAVEEEEEQPP